MIVVNLEKAKEIGHVLRRRSRDKEFAPHDAIIMKQIPGNDMQAAEAARQAIREKYEAMQEQIDSAQNTDEIKAALGAV
jgi:hypothetical protein